MDDFSRVTEYAAKAEVIALLILIAGFFVARFASAGIGAVLAALDRRTARMATTDKSLFAPKMIRVVRAVVFWLVQIVAVLLALRVLGMGGVNPLLSVVLAFAPQALVAFSIIVGGHLLGLIASQLLSSLDGVDVDSMGPRLVHGLIVVVAVVLGLQQVNVDISFVTRLILVLTATISAGLMLAFALGARQYVANLLAHRELTRLEIGQVIRVGDVEGKIVEIRHTAIDLATSDGVVSIPASWLTDREVFYHEVSASDE